MKVYNLQRGTAAAQTCKARLHNASAKAGYGRQNGNWISIISKYNDEEFLKKYSLLNKPEEYVFPPTFLAHSFKDNDVPYSESINLSKIIKDSCLFTCSADEHDFDRLEKDKNTIDLLNKTIDFLNNHG